jgi:hypothetical protein
MGSTVNWKTPVSQPLKDEDTARNHYRRHLLNRLMSLFVWDGFAESVPTQYIEQILLLNGVCGFIEHDGDIIPVTAWGAEAPDEFYRAKKFTYAQPVLGSGTIDADSVIYNDNLAPWFGFDCKDVLDKYADLLAMADISIKIAIKNSRLTHIIATDNESDVNNINRVLDGVSNGAMATAIFSRTMIGDGVRLLPATNYGTDFMRQLSETAEYLYNRFLSEFGVHANTVLKRERQLTDELEMQAERPAFNVWSMLQSRLEGCERINKKFGTNISVRLNPAITIVEDMADDNGDIYDEAETEDTEQPAETEDTEPPAEVEDTEQPAETEDTEPPAETENTEPPAEVEDTEPPADIEINISINADNVGGDIDVDTDTEKTDDLENVSEDSDDSADNTDQ